MLKIFTITLVVTLCISMTYLKNTAAKCKPINTTEFHQCVKSCTATTDHSKFVSDFEVLRYCVAQCLVLLKECDYLDHSEKK